MTNGFRELAERRKNGINALKENGWYDGFKRLLTDLYPENAHFIYELLQNAEDAKATIVQFRLSSTSLEFEHDGQKQFQLADVISITSIGNSTKRDDPTSIGKFGVGFKAVFAYTLTPEIHSGDFHFCLKEFFVPVTDGVSVRESGGKTLFVFPFDQPAKTPTQAVADITRGLAGLRDNTLLFLAHIKRIEYTFPDGSSGYLDRADTSENQIQITIKPPNRSEVCTSWLRFMEPVSVGDGTDKSHNIAVAYAMERESSNSSQWRIIGINGQVSIYFPAVSELSNLKFHLHAPFASTIARDCVRECDENDQLCDNLASLVVKSLDQIKNSRLLSMSFLEVLPNSRDSIPGRFDIIRQAIVKAFVNTPLTPTKNGKYAPALTLRRGPAQISQLLNDDDLRKLLKISHKQDVWVANPPPQSQRADHFLSSLNIARWGANELFENLLEYGRNGAGNLKDFLKAKNDDWMRRFYEVLYSDRERYANIPRPTLDVMSLVRVESDSGKLQVSSSNAFFSVTDEINGRPRGICFVSPSVYVRGKKETIKSEARLFLEAIGVRLFDENARVQKMLDSYGAQAPSNSEHLDHIRHFVRLFVARQVDPNIFKGRSFLRRQTTTPNGQIQWSIPGRICIDFSGYPTGLGKLSSIHGAHAASEEYPSLFTGSSFNGLIEFLKAIGCMHKLSVIDVPIDKNVHANTLRQVYGNVNDNMTQQDWTIYNLEKYLSAKSVEASRLVWNAMIDAAPGCTTARYRPNKSADEATNESQLVWHLRNTAWIPTTTPGEFKKPRDTARSELLPDFIYKTQNGMLTAISFESAVRERTVEYQAKDGTAKALGFKSAKEAEEVAKMLREFGKTPEEIRQLIAPPVKPDQPSSSVTDPVRRGKKIEEQAESAEEIESAIRERQVRIHESAAKQTAKVWLRSKYTNSASQLICQLCQDVMPFKLPRTDEFYFEAVQLLQDFKQWHTPNYLALCPTCSAMYQNARETDSKAIRDLVANHASAPSDQAVEIRIRIAGRAMTLRFVGTHWFDLKAVIKSETKRLESN